MRYVVFAVKAGVAAGLALLFFALGLVGLFAGLWPVAVFLLVLAVPFALVFFIYGSTLTVESQGLSLSFFGIKRRSMSWDQVREVGILGSAVMNAPRGIDKSGTVYLYFSPKELTKQDRFRMGVSWPPRDKLFMRYAPDRLETVQRFWSGKIELYNEGNIRI